MGVVATSPSAGSFGFVRRFVTTAPVPPASTACPSGTITSLTSPFCSPCGGVMAFLSSFGMVLSLLFVGDQP